MDASRPRILVFIEYYLPGCKSGGPVRSVANLVDFLGDRFDFWIVTQDRDLTDSTPYPGVETGCWIQVGKAMVFYSPLGKIDGALFERLIAELDPAAIYLNSYFSTIPRRFLLARRFRTLPDIPVVISPRGELGMRVLQLKPLKKRLYITMASWLGLYDDLLWVASSPHEESEIRAAIGQGVDIGLAPNLPRAVPESAGPDAHPVKRPGTARLVFLSRISPKKNLAFALEALRKVSGAVTFNIYGPIDSTSYWETCQKTIATLPANIQVTYRGSVDNERVLETLETSHFLVLPTLNENFGHSIFESFVAGCPVVLSDQTPWRDLATQDLGWDLSPDDPELWRRALQECVNMEEDRFRTMSAACVAFARSWPVRSHVVEKSLALLEAVVRRREPSPNRVDGSVSRART